jgi:ribosomal protein S18 acetylase RimI-like enzyme
MNELKIRQYQDIDCDVISKMFGDFIVYLATIDPINRIINKQSGYGENYLKKTLKDVKNRKGIFLIAEMKNTIVGFGVAIIATLSKDELMEVVPHTPGRVTELFVDNQYRGMGIGTKIMDQLEIYLKQNGCNSINIEVFAPNNKTHDLYKKLDYVDRNVDMIKVF